jgi:hypothetical protein
MYYFEKDELYTWFECERDHATARVAGRYFLQVWTLRFAEWLASAARRSLPLRHTWDGTNQTWRK